jgi:hypothetical protein
MEKGHGKEDLATSFPSSGYLPAGVLAEIIANILRGKTIDRAVDLSLSPLRRYEGYYETIACLEKARDLVRSNLTPTTFQLFKPDPNSL